MKRIQNTQLKSVDGRLAVVSDGQRQANITPLMIFKASLGEAKATKEQGGLDLSKAILGLAKKLNKIDAEAKTIDLEELELTALKIAMNSTSGLFQAVFEAQAVEAIENAKELVAPKQTRKPKKG